MRGYRYVTLDPTGNITALVTDPVDPADESAVTRALLGRSEHVAYLEEPEVPAAAARIRLMGGEFCGNAAMAAAAWLARGELRPGEKKQMFLEVSGAAAPVLCAVRRTENGFEGTVQMPGVPEVTEETLCGVPFTVVRMEGITHLVCEGRNYTKDEAESLLSKIAAQLSDDAVGLLQWDPAAGRMLPLVWVRGSRSMVWEHGCGSGSAAVGAYEALKSGDGVHTVSVRQPGGTILAAADAAGGRIRSVSITGEVRIGMAERIFH